MSISELESQKITKSVMKPYCRLDDNTIDPAYALAVCRFAYVAGRTAKPTGAEIKAVVRAMYSRHYSDWESDEDYARHLLESAREAVAE